MRLFLSFVILFASVVFTNRNLNADTPGESELWENIYSKALIELRNSTDPIQKARAAYTLGWHGNPRNVRPLMAELLKGVKQANPKLRFDENIYAYVTIAQALGKIAHPVSVPTLLEALDTTINLSTQQVKETQERIKRAKELYNSVEKNKNEEARREDPHVTLLPRRVAPYQGKQANFPENASQYWSIADTLKNDMDSVSSRDKGRIVNYGSNYINLARSIFFTLGSIGSIEAIQGVAKYLDAQKYSPSIRSYSALTLGAIGGAKAQELLEKSFREEKSSETILSMAYAILRNDKTKGDMYFIIIGFLKTGTIEERLIAAKVLRDLRMGEALETLKASYKIEYDHSVRSMLREAILSTQRDAIYSFTSR